MEKNPEINDLKIVEDNIEIRLDNYIYAFSTNTIPNYLKIGDTSKGVTRRIKQWEKILNKRLSPQIVKITKEYDHPASVKDNEKKLDMYFRDYSVHKYIREVLHKDSIDITDPDLLKLYSKEFFKDVTINEVDNAIQSIIEDALSTNPEKTYTFYSKSDLDENSKKVEFHWSNDKEWKLRPNQKNVVENFLSKRSKKELLMYAVMRFGKSFTAMQCALKDNRDKVMIVCAKRDVQGEWKQTIEKPKCFKDYAFICDDDLKTGKTIKEILKEREKSKYAIFLTLQNISGKAYDGIDIKERLKDIYKEKYDLLIVDETHYGAWAKIYGQPLTDDEDAGTIREDEKEYEELINKTKKYIKAKQKLHLSGTPYNLLYNNKFDENNIIATYQFKDILDEKENWNRDHMLDIENGEINEETGKPYQEFDNPYFGFPQMLRFAFNLPEEWIEKLKTKSQNGVKWSLTELFKTKKVENKLKFIHEDEVIKLLKAIDGSSKQSGILGFLNIPKIRDNNVCKHIVMVLPYRSSCDAMEALLIKNKKKFINLCNYEKIINITGKNAPSSYSNIDNIKNDISKCEEEGKKTISLTVHKMLTGVTVKEWDTMIMLKNTKSAQEYDQAIFRIQNQYVVEYNDLDGNIYKKDMKPQTILVDFDPARFFEIQGLSSRIVDKVTNGDVTLEDSIVKELSYFPIITYNADKLVQVTAKNLIEVITNYNKDKSIIDESNSINLDRNILNNEYLLKYIEAQSDASLINKLKEKAHEGDKTSDIEEPKDSKVDVDLDDDTESTSGTKKDKYKDMLQRYRLCIACVLFYAFLTNSTVGKLEDVLKSVEENSDELERNKRIFENLKLDKKFIKLHIKNCARSYSFNIDNSIKKANLLSKDHSLKKEERVRNALHRFNKFSDSEFVTPIELCNKLIKTLDVNYIVDIINNGGKILDIASKTGEFTFTIYNTLKDKVDANILKNAIYSIPTSTMTYEFTRKIYELLDLNLDCLSEKINSFDLIEKFNDSIKPSKFMKLIFPKRYKEIEKGEENMKFGAVIGNPPYQSTVREASVGNNKNTVDIYQKFQDISLKISDATCLIYPAKEFQRGEKNTLDESLMSLRIFNGSNREGEKRIPSEESVFGDAVRRIPGDVGLVYYNKDKSKQKKLFTYQDIEIERTDKILPVIKEYINLAKKLEKYANTFKFSNVKKVCESSFVEDHSSSVLNKKVDRTKKAPDGYTKVLTNHKKGSGGKSKWFYIKTADLDKKPTNEYKLILPSARPNESFANSDDLEILDKDECFGRSKKCIYDSYDLTKIINCKRYLSTKFAKVVNAMTPEEFLYYLPDFNDIYDSIEWPKEENDEKAIEEINKQLYRILKLDKSDIKVIEEFKIRKD